MLRIFRYGAFSLSAAEIARFSHSLSRALYLIHMVASVPCDQAAELGVNK